jgi:GWxTD domain-containing protein
MRILKTAALLTAAAFLAGQAAALPSRSEGQVDFWVDGAAFAGPDGKTWQELYWSFSPNQLKARDSLGQRTAAFRTVITLADSAGKQRLGEDWRTSAPMPDSALAAQRSMVQLDQLAVSDLEPGSYRLSVGIYDLVSGSQGLVEAEVEVPSFSGRTPAVSQVELASDIAADSTTSRFRKGGLTVRPHPERVFGDATNNRLFYYAEAYKVEKAHSIRVAFSSFKDPTLRVVDTRVLSGQSGAVVQYGGMVLDEMENGYYRLWIQALDAGGGVLASSQANFKVERDILERLPQYRRIMEEQAVLEKEAGEYYSKIDLIANQAELAAYARLSQAGRREFLRQFWRKRDPSPDTPENEALREHVNRYRQADAEFREQARAGSETDRGKAYIKHGPPDEVEKRLLEAETKDVLVWKYNSGQVLMFWDRLGVGRFEMVYDKHNPQRSDPRFQRLLNQ